MERYLPKKYRKMTFACSNAVSWVLSEKVVHSIDRSKNSSASVSGGWGAINDGKAPFSDGNIYQ
jgi:hypothetical protein